MFLHLSPRYASLPGTGPGCTILLDQAAPGALVLPATTNAFGSGSYGVAIPSDYVLIRDLFAQWSYFDTYTLTFGGFTSYYNVERRTDGLWLRIGA